jgi:hypothetical protein
VPRTLIGAGAAAFEKTFDLTAAVVPGSTVDFVVDPGAGQHGMSDSASLAARITVP